MEALYFAVSSSDLPREAALNRSNLAPIVTLGAFIPGPCKAGDGDACSGYDSVSITLTPPPNAEAKCLGVRLRLWLPAFYIQLNITAASAAVNVTGDVDSQLVRLHPSLHAVSVVTDSAPVTFTNVFADSRVALPAAIFTNNSILAAILADFPGGVLPNNTADDPSDPDAPLVDRLQREIFGALNSSGVVTYVAPPAFAPSVSGASTSGAISFSSVFAPGIYGASGGGVRFANAAGLCLWGGRTKGPLISPPLGGGPTACGVVEGHAFGRGTLGVSNLLLARSAAFTTELGKIVCANAAALVGTSLDFLSQRGNVYLTNLLQGAGNETRVSTRGSVAASATFVNRLVVSTADAGAVSLVALFVGINSSSQLSFDLGSVKVELPLLALFNPQPADYSAPLVAASTDFGDISALSLGGNPQASGFANVVSVDFRSRDGAIKLEVNGGGINADYDVSSGAANAIVEVDGRPAPLRGYIGKGGSGNNSIVLRSERDNVQLSRAFEGGGKAAPPCLPSLTRAHGL
jgi:hypothetical protein